jgi:hypothetical protein
MGSGKLSVRLVALLVAVALLIGFNGRAIAQAVVAAQGAGAESTVTINPSFVTVEKTSLSTEEIAQLANASGLSPDEIQAAGTGDLLLLILLAILIYPLLVYDPYAY